MKKSKSVIILLITIVTILFITREFGLFNCYWADYIITQNYNHNFKEGTVNIATSKTGFHTDFGNHKFSQTDIFIRDIGKKPNPNEDYGLEIIIKKVTIPFSFIPFYTNIDYEFDAMIKDNISAVEDDSLNVKFAKRTIIGNITLKGNFKNYGLLSNKEIKKIITNDTKIFLTQQVKKYLQVNE